MKLLKTFSLLLVFLCFVNCSSDNTEELDSTVPEKPTAPVVLPDTNADLDAFSVDVGTLVPEFSTEVLDYRVDDIPFSSANLSLNLELGSSKATVKLNDDLITSDLTAVTAPIVVGENTVEVTVIAENLDEKIYTFIFTRAAASVDFNLSALSLSQGNLSPTFDENIVSYSVNFSDTAPNFTVQATTSAAESTLGYSLNSALYSTLSSGVASDPITPLIGPNTFDVQVTAEDGNTKIYGINMTYGPCDTGTYSDVNNLCVPAGIGFWSAASSNVRNTCSNKPTNSRYTSPTAPSSNCAWSCDDGYLTTDGVTCVASTTATSLYCDDNEIAVGLNGRSGAILDRIGVRCAVLNPDGTTGVVRNGPTYGGGGGTTFNMTGSHDCPAGFALFEVDGSLGSFDGANRTGRIRFRCKSLTTAALSSWSPSDTTYWGGDTSRGAFNYQCGVAPNNNGSFLNGVIIDNASGASYSGDFLGITCR